MSEEEKLKDRTFRDFFVDGFSITNEILKILRVFRINFLKTQSRNIFRKYDMTNVEKFPFRVINHRRTRLVAIIITIIIKV